MTLRSPGTSSGLGAETLTADGGAGCGVVAAPADCGVVAAPTGRLGPRARLGFATAAAATALAGGAVSGGGAVVEGGCVDGRRASGGCLTLALRAPAGAARGGGGDGCTTLALRAPAGAARGGGGGGGGGATTRAPGRSDKHAPQTPLSCALRNVHAAHVQDLDAAAGRAGLTAEHAEQCCADAELTSVHTMQVQSCASATGFVELDGANSQAPHAATPGALPNVHTAHVHPNGFPAASGCLGADDDGVSHASQRCASGELSNVHKTQHQAARGGSIAAAAAVIAGRALAQAEHHSACDAFTNVHNAHVHSLRALARSSGIAHTRQISSLNKF